MDTDRSAVTAGLVHGGAAACILAMGCAAPALQAAPAPKDVFLAHPAVRYDPKDRCPELRVSDEGDTATVLFTVNSFGTPSQASIRSPSGIAGLDEAAVACVMRLKFQPATRPGDAQPLDSWQQIGLRYAARPNAAAPVTATAPVTAAAPVAAGNAAIATTAAAVASTAAVAPAAAASQGGGTSEVHVCADAAGKLTQEPVVTRSSGNAALDAAAMKIARSGAGAYHPAGATSLSGCAQLKVTFEGR